jgi:hypothetical protein
MSDPTQFPPPQPEAPLPPQSQLPPNVVYQPYTAPQPTYALARTKSTPTFLYVALGIFLLDMLAYIPYWVTGSNAALGAYIALDFFLGFGTATAGVIVLVRGTRKYGDRTRSKPLLTQLGAFIGVLMVCQIVIEVLVIAFNSAYSVTPLGGY